MITVNTIESYKDYGRCIEITNGVISAIITVDIGPRIISFGYVGSQNFMCDQREALGGKPYEAEYTKLFGENRRWENLGGHRLWIAPESYPETYTPDDKPCLVEITQYGAVFTYSEDTEIGFQKQLEIKMDDDDANMQVIMRATNTGKARELALWGITVCKKSGTLIIPMNTVDTGLLPNRKISLWPYTDISDDIYYWGKKYITVTQKERDGDYASKIGVDLNCGTAYYCLGDEIFYKRFDANHPDGDYVDGGCSLETYICNKMLEFETLGELKWVEKGETVEHTESWSLCRKPCEVDFNDDNSIDNLLNKL